jgi:hypothetical protein
LKQSMRADSELTNRFHELNVPESTKSPAYDGFVSPSCECRYCASSSQQIGSLSGDRSHEPP